MANIKFSGTNPRDPLDLAFDWDDEPIINLITPARVVLTNPDNNYTIDFRGNGLVLVPGDDFIIGGTLTSITINNPSGQSELEITNINWSFRQFADGIDELFDDGFEDAEPVNFIGLLSQQPLTIDATERFAFTDIDLTGVTSNSTFLSSPFGSEFAGGDGNDTIRLTARTDGIFASHFIEASPGADIIDISALPRNSFVGLDYTDAPIPIVASFNGIAGTGTITKGNFGTDTVVGFSDSPDTAEIGIFGSRNNDTFNISGVGNFFVVEPVGGNNTININLNAGGLVRLDYDFWTGAPNVQGVAIDLRTGVVSNNGFGGTDQINIAGDNGRIEIHGSAFADNIIGSDRDERFILGGGNSALDGGGGWNILRYDRAGYNSGVFVDLEQGSATGAWFGNGFFQSLNNIQEVWGSSGNDYLAASNAGSRLEGRGGNNTIFGGEGNDTLIGGNGDDYIDPRNNNGFSLIDPGLGNDIVSFPDTNRGFFEIQHREMVNRGPMQFTVMSETDDPFDTGSGFAMIDKGVFGQTEIVSARAPMRADGLLLVGTHFGDSFDISLADGDQLEIRAGRGQNEYSIQGDGRVRLEFDRDADWQRATEGLVANLSSGVIANNGFGFTNTLTVDGETQLDIVGTTHADQIIGRDGSDFFMPLGGNDTLDGGGGFNLVSYNQRETGPVRVDLGAGTAQGFYDGVAFTDTMTNIQGALGSRNSDSWLKGSDVQNYLRGFNGNDSLFGDGFFAAYDLDAGRAVYRLYQATLGREPDTGGQSGWTEQLASGANSLLGVATGFVGSREFQRDYGGLSNTEFVSLLYQNVLGREADAGGLAGWVAALESGQSQAQVVLGFSESREFINSTNRAATEFTLARDPATWQGDVFRLYQATLGREPDAGGFDGWVSALSQGTPFMTAVAGFVGSREFQNTYGALDDTGFVTLLYQNVLGRAPDAGGLAGWVSALAGGTSRAEVVSGFSRSNEFIRDTAPALRDWIRAQGQDDFLDSSGGSNDLWGGAMADVFRFRAAGEGEHRVHDFEAWDYLDFRGFSYRSAADALAHMSQQGADVVFADQGTTVTLLNTQLADITADTFMFS